MRERERECERERDYDVLASIAFISDSSINMS